MFRIPTEPQSWSADHAAALRQFLATSSGQALLQQLYQKRPRPAGLPSPDRLVDPERRKLEAEALLSYENAIDDLISLTISPDE
jgi:hypothetical protein